MSTETLETGLHISSLSIKGFRGIADLSIPRLGQVTLIVGENNTGKTSILEGVRLLAEGAAPEVIREILQFREENTGGVSNDGESLGGESFLASALFHGFPQLSEISEPIVISSGEHFRHMQMEVGWYSERVEENGDTKLIPVGGDFSEGYDSIPALVVTTEGGTRIYPIDQFDRLTANRRSLSRNNPKRISSRFVSSSGAERTEMLGPLWDNISLTEREPHVLRALQLIDPQITAVSMVGERSTRQSRTAVVRSESFSRRVPLRSFGDGMNRLFGIILSLVNVNGGILLIDEFENGMHHEIQLAAWRMILGLAHELKVQVLATTHSFDCIVGFARAAVEMNNLEGLLIRIDRIGDRMRAVEYNEEDLHVVARQRIEVR